MVTIDSVLKYVLSLQYHSMLPSYAVLGTTLLLPFCLRRKPPDDARCFVTLGYTSSVLTGISPILEGLVELRLLRGP